MAAHPVQTIKFTKKYKSDDKTPPANSSGVPPVLQLPPTTHTTPSTPIIAPPRPVNSNKSIQPGPVSGHYSPKYSGRGFGGLGGYGGSVTSTQNTSNTPNSGRNNGNSYGGSRGARPNSYNGNKYVVYFTFIIFNFISFDL